MVSNKEKTIACQYDWLESTRHKLKVISLWSGKSMAEMSSMAVDLFYIAFEGLRKKDVAIITATDFEKILSEILKENPEYIGIVKSVSSL